MRQLWCLAKASSHKTKRSSPSPCQSLELRVTDATNEANDNVRYLVSLEPSLEVGGAYFAQLLAAPWASCVWFS
jgi:hypothetical protein